MSGQKEEEKKIGYMFDDERSEILHKIIKAEEIFRSWDKLTLIESIIDNMTEEELDIFIAAND